MRLISVVRLLSTSTLFVVFFAIFGMSSIQKYIQGDIVTVSRTENNDGCLPLPAIMVCPEGQYDGAWEEDCKQHYKNLNKMDACSRKHAYTLNETILDTSVRISNGTVVGSINLSSWTSMYTIPYLGTCYTLRSSQICLNSGETMLIKFIMEKSYSIYLFDPQFFMPKRDNSVIPFLLLDNPMSKGISLQSTFTSKMNRPKSPCNPDNSYSYNQCVRTHMAQRIGCTNPFDGSRHFQNSPNCNTSEELLAHWTANFDIFNVNKKKKFNITECEFPCNYHKYSVVGTPLKWEMKGVSYINLFYTSTDIITSQEVLLYPFDSLVSEFGGALGLFLGFSFLGLLDIIQTSCSTLMTRLKIDRLNLI